MSNNCLESNDELTKKLELQIRQGYEFIDYLKGNHSIEEMNKLFISWRRETKTVLFKIFDDNKNGKLFLIKTDKEVNKFSKVDTINILTEGTNIGINFIQELIEELKKDMLLIYN